MLLFYSIISCSTNNCTESFVQEILPNLLISWIQSFQILGCAFQIRQHRAYENSKFSSLDTSSHSKTLRGIEKILHAISQGARLWGENWKTFPNSGAVFSYLTLKQVLEN